MGSSLKGNILSRCTTTPSLQNERTGPPACTPFAHPSLVRASAADRDTGKTRGGAAHRKLGRGGVAQPGLDWEWLGRRGKARQRAGRIAGDAPLAANLSSKSHH